MKSYKDMNEEERKEHRERINSKSLYGKRYSF